MRLTFHFRHAFSRRTLCRAGQARSGRAITDNSWQRLRKGSFSQGVIQRILTRPALPASKARGNQAGLRQFPSLLLIHPGMVYRPLGTYVPQAPGSVRASYRVLRLIAELPTHGSPSWLSQDDSYSTFGTRTPERLVRSGFRHSPAGTRNGSTPWEMAKSPHPGFTTGVTSPKGMVPEHPEGVGLGNRQTVSSPRGVIMPVWCQHRRLWSKKVLSRPPI